MTYAGSKFSNSPQNNSFTAFYAFELCKEHHMEVGGSEARTGF